MLYSSAVQSGGTPDNDTPPPYTKSTDDVQTASSTPASSGLSKPTARSNSPSRHSSAPATKGNSLLAPSSRQPQQVRTTLPTNLQRARAPLQVKQENASIANSFLVINDSPSKHTNLPAVSLQTRNASINAAVYVRADAWLKPVTIEAQTCNSSIVLAVHTLQASQAVDIRAMTSYASCSVLLPRDFKGLLILSTTNSKAVLAAELQQVSVRVPCKLKSDDQDNISNYNNLPKSVIQDIEDGRAEWYEINGGSGPSRAIVQSRSAKVSAGYAGTGGMLGKWGNENCMLM